MDWNTLWNEMDQNLPDQFNFYDLGTVERGENRGEADEIQPDQIGVAFSIYSSEELSPIGVRSLMLLTFDEGLQADIYMEIGNILASRIAGQIHRKVGESILITPPLLLKNPAVQRLVQMKSHVLTDCTYRHVHDGKSIPLRVTVMKVEGDSAGHA
jgi:hypothetical protein